MTTIQRRFAACALFLSASLVGASAPAADEPVFRAGAHAIDVSPTTFPVNIIGGFLQQRSESVVDRLHSRSLVLDDGASRLAIVVVDSCMLPRELIDKAKAIASAGAGIPTERMLISATHTHSAPAGMGGLGTNVDEAYAEWLPGRIADGIVLAAKNLAPARVGWTVVNDWRHTFNRRWITRPDKMLTDPFGVKSVRSMMHPGYENPDYTGPSGPVDPGLSLLAVQSLDGRPVALLANYSQHYFGATPVSADYFGKFSEGIGKLIGAGAGEPPLVGMMSQGTSGDLMWMDYSQPKKNLSSDKYAEELMQVAASAVKRIEYRDFASLAMAEARLTLRRRVPDSARLEWAKGMMAEMGDRLPANRTEVYAREQVLIAAEPQREIKLQAMRIGDFGIAALPNEVFAITGLKLKAQSPLQPTMNVALANGGEGYTPPPEQHKLGGYTTWAARTAGLEEEAEPRIVETLLALLEKVAGKPRPPLVDALGAYSEAVLSSKPIAYWRLNEIAPPRARDATGNGHEATYEDGIAMYLPGAQSQADAVSAAPENPSVFSGSQINRCPHFAGGRLRVDLPRIARRYSVEFWLWNGMAANLRPVTGYLVSRGSQGDATAAGDHLGIGGTSNDGAMTDRLFFFNGNKANSLVVGRTALGLRQWHHVVCMRNERRVTIYLDGQLEAEGDADWTVPDGVASTFLGGRCDNFANFEGKMDEVAVYDRALAKDEVERHFKLAGRTPKPAATETSSQPLEPAESLRKIHVPKGFQVELVAAEPAVLDPVAFDWDARGRLWVVEMADYPLGIDGQGKPGGRVRLLEDADGDGRYETSRLFAEGLNFPNGILTWRDGALVTAAPDILLLRDTNGDGRADVREVLFHGFNEGNQQLRVNGLRWGLDNRVYCANGGHHANYGKDTRIVSRRTGKTFELGSRDFSFDPDTGDLALESGPTQFGRNRDPWGHWFGTQNANPLWQYVLPDRYLQRNPYVPAPSPIKHVFGSGSPLVYPASAPEKRYHSFQQAGRFTSACAGMIYGDNRLFGESSNLHAFVCEPFHNLVQHQVLSDAAVSFTAQRAPGEERFDFFASEDRWCRPVMVRTGPDGAVWVADMYRYMIEHPQFLPQTGKDELMPRYRLGDDRGRIYRVTPANSPAAKPVRLDHLDTTGLVTALDSSNAWQRDKAQQMLVWKRDASAVSLLERLAESSPRPATRLQALCTLDGLAGLQSKHVLRALADQNPRVRENALRLAEPLAAPEVIAAVAKLVDDRDAKVRLQLALSLGEWRGDAPARALARLAVQSSDDDFLVAAVMSSALPFSKSLIEAVMRSEPGVVERYSELLLRQAIGTADADAVAALLSESLTSKRADPLRNFSRMLLLLERAGGSWEKLQSARDLPSVVALVPVARELFEQASRLAADPTAADDARLASATLLCRSREHRAAGVDVLAGFLKPRYSPELQSQAVAALAQSEVDGVPRLLAQAWPELGAALRQRTLDAWMSRRAWTEDLLGRLESNEIVAASIDSGHRDRLIRYPVKAVAARAAKAFEATGDASRGKVIEEFRSALALNGDAARGKQVYMRACVACHKHGQEGRDIGPNLATVTGHAPEKLLINILDPSADIQPGYQVYTCVLASGETLSGLLVAETANSLSIKQADGAIRTVTRREVDILHNSSRSLMPDRLEKLLQPQDVADLIGFLRTPAP